MRQVYSPYSGGKLAQAGVALLQYPLAFPMDEALARRDLQYYGAKFDFEMMFFGQLTYAINWLRFGRSDRADAVFDLAFYHQVCLSAERDKEREREKLTVDIKLNEVNLFSVHSNLALVIIITARSAPTTCGAS